MLVLVCGSRTWDEPLTMKRRLHQLPFDAEIIHGGARGADMMAATFARSLGIPETCYPAQWREHGKKAGILRNLQMLDRHPDLVLAFWDGVSSGTRHVIEEATRRDIDVEIIEPERKRSESEPD